MEFCPICETRLITKNRGKIALHCPKCKKKYEASAKKISKVNTPTKQASNFTEQIVVLDRKTLKLKTLPTVDAICIKCKGKKAETWTLDLGSEDNMQSIFFRCTSCRYTWRETE